MHLKNCSECHRRGPGRSGRSTPRSEAAAAPLSGLFSPGLSQVSPRARLDHELRVSPSSTEAHS
eukprot:747288-Hanusia_phi.AAC.1